MLFRPRTLAVVLILITSFGDSSIRGQESCDHVPHPGPEDLRLSIFKADLTCEVSPGGYVKRGVPYKIHTLASAEGWCQLRGWDCRQLPCVCVDLITSPNERGVRIVGNVEFAPAVFGIPFNIGPISPNGGETHLMNSQIPGTTTPEGRSWTFWYVGRSSVIQQSDIDVTQCNMTPNSVTRYANVDVVRCLPAFRIDPQTGQLVRVPHDATRIRIASPQTQGPLRNAIEAATVAWNSGLTSWGLSAVFEPNAETTACRAEEGGHCVKVLVQNDPVEPAACAGTHRDGGGEDGFVDTNPIIYVRPGYSTNEGYLNRLFAHEFGHLLGLENTPNCALADSIMSVDPRGCNVLDPFAVTSPQPTDFLPIVDTVYGSGSRNSCG